MGKKRDKNITIIKDNPKKWCENMPVECSCNKGECNMNKRNKQLKGIDQVIKDRYGN